MVSNAETSPSEHGPSEHGLLAAAEQRIENGDPRAGLRILFDLLRLAPLHQKGLETAARLSADLGSRQEAELFAALLADPEDPQNLYDMGFTFVEAGLPEVGMNYLQLCHERVPDDFLVRYELAYALFLAGRYAEALPLLEGLTVDPNHAGPEPLAAGLLLVEAYLYAGDAERARASHERLAAGDITGDAAAQLDALSLLLARADLFPDRETLGPREWYFIEHGGVILQVQRNPLGELHRARLDAPFLAGLMRRLLIQLLALDQKPEVIQSLSDQARPIADVLARRLGVASEPFDANRGGRSLIVMLHPGEASAHLAELRDHEEGVELFALFSDPRREYPLAPEITGLWAAEIELPWSRDREEGAQACSEILDEMDRIDGDEADLKGQLTYYLALRDLLVLGNAGRFPSRRMLTARRVH